ncbi:hypothetical protein RBB50_001575 [Rhinocladiella similis]
MDTVVKALSEYSTCDVSDALGKLGVPHGGFLAGPTLWSPERQNGKTKIIGPAYTVQYVPVGDEVSPKCPSHYIDSVPSGAVIVISAPATINAVYGSLMSTRAQASGAVGTVVDGRIRDLQDHRDLGYPVFAREIGTAAPYGVARVSGFNVPIEFSKEGGTVSVQPGDYVVGDLNGVVCIPAKLAGKVVELIAPQVEADINIARDLRHGVPFTEASKRHRAKLTKT